MKATINLSRKEVEEILTDKFEDNYPGDSTFKYSFHLHDIDFVTIEVDNHRPTIREETFK